MRIPLVHGADLLGRPVPCAPFVLRDVVQASVKLLAATAAAFQVAAQRRTAGLRSNVRLFVGHCSPRATHCSSAPANASA